MVNDALSILNKSLDLVGKRNLDAEQLKEFVLSAIKHDVKELTTRREMFENKEIENEVDINNFPFYTDGYRFGVFVELNEDNIFLFRDKDGNEIQVMQLYKKDKDKQFIRDEDGELIPTGRCLMRIKARRGFMGIFIGIDKVKVLDDKGHYYVLVGGLTSQYKVANSEDDYHKKKEDGVEYTDFPSFTLNVWQLGEVIRTKSGKINIKLPECNWKEEKENSK